MMHATIYNTKMVPLTGDIEISADVEFEAVEKKAAELAVSETKCCIQWSRDSDGQVAYWSPSGATLTPYWYSKPKVSKPNTNHPMYALGMICRHIWSWPNGDQAMPNNIMEMMLSRPMTALGLASRSPAMRDCDQDQLAELMARLPTDFGDPSSGNKVSDVDQGRFWIGYYHYLSAMDHAKRYGPDDLVRCGEALYGEHWQASLADALDLSDTSRIRQWLKRGIPPSVWVDVAALLRQREIQIKTVLDGITKAGDANN